MAKEKKSEKVINLKLTPRFIERGDWGSEFYISTFRFPLAVARDFERRCKSLGLTMSTTLNQLVESFNDAVPAPKGKVALERTAHPTIWGKKAKAAYYKGKGLKVPVKRVDENPGNPAKSAKPEGSKKKAKASKKEKPKVQKVKAVIAAKNKVETKKVAKKPEGKKLSGSMAAALARLKSLRKEEAA